MQHAYTHGFKPPEKDHSSPARADAPLMVQHQAQQKCCQRRRTSTDCRLQCATLSGVCVWYVKRRLAAAAAAAAERPLVPPSWFWPQPDGMCLPTTSFPHHQFSSGAHRMHKTPLSPAAPSSARATLSLPTTFFQHSAMPSLPLKTHSTGSKGMRIVSHSTWTVVNHLGD